MLYLLEKGKPSKRMQFNKSMCILQQERKSAQKLMSKSIFNATKGNVECNLVAAEERVIMQTALMDFENGKAKENGIKQGVRVLLDSEIKGHIYQRTLLTN